MSRRPPTPQTSSHTTSPVCSVHSSPPSPAPSPPSLTVTGCLPLPPLSINLFLLVVSNLHPVHLLPLLSINRTWNKILTTHPELWTSLQTYLGGRDQKDFLENWFKRARGSSQIPRGPIQVGITVPSPASPRQRVCPDPVPLPILMQQYSQLKTMLLNTCVYDAGILSLSSTLRGFVLQLYPTGLSSVQILQDFCSMARNPLFSSLKDLSVHINLGRFFLDDTFFLYWPSLRNLTLRCTLDNPSNLNLGRCPLTSSPPVTEIPTTTVVSSLETLSLCGLVIPHPVFIPQFSHLVHITFVNIAWVGRKFFALMKECSMTLETLEVRNLNLVFLSDDAEDTLDWQDTIDGPDDEDEGAIEALLFPSLKRLIVTGSTTPPFFASLDLFNQALFHSDSDVEENDPTTFMIHNLGRRPTPLFYMPSLEQAHIAEIPTLMGEDAHFEDEEDEIPSTWLFYMAHAAPSTKHLTLSNLTLGSEALLSALTQMSGMLTLLSLTETCVTDTIFLHFLRLLPRLEILDVRETRCTVQGVGNLVSEYLEEYGRKTPVPVTTRDGVITCWRYPQKIKLVYVDPPKPMMKDNKINAILHHPLEERAWEWLDFIGVLGRDEDDFSGPGPRDPVRYKIWKKEGKKTQRYS